MQNKWYSDNRDLVKWSILLLLAKKYNINHIIQVAYFRSNPWKKIEVDGVQSDIPVEVISHFRNLHRIEQLSPGVTVSVIDDLFDDRKLYQARIQDCIEKTEKNIIVFLDPDTGLQPRKIGWDHVSEEELTSLWKSLRRGSFLVLYQHSSRDRNWKEKKRQQFAKCIAVELTNISIGCGPNIAKDVIFLIARKN